MRHRPALGSSAVNTPVARPSPAGARAVVWRYLPKLSDTSCRVQLAPVAVNGENTGKPWSMSASGTKRPDMPPPTLKPRSSSS